MNAPSSFQGTVMPRGAPGPLVAEVTFGNGVMRVHSQAGPLELPLSSVQISLGGASGHMVFVVAPLLGVTVCVEHDSFISALRAAANGMLDEQCNALVKHKSKMRVWQWVTGSVLVLIVIALTQVPRMVMGAVGGLPISVDRQIGDVAYQAMRAQLGGEDLNNPEVNAALRAILARLTPHAATSGMDFRFQVVESDDVNAFALPGGQIVVYSGLLKKATRPEQVAGVLAHEIAHATLRHGVRGIARTMGIRYGFALLFGDVSGLFQYAEAGALIAVIQGYSRDQENEADEEGVRMMIAAGIDPRGLAEFFQMMKNEPATELPGMVQWLSSHPEHDERIANVNRLARSAPRASVPPLAIDWPRVQSVLGGTTTSAQNKSASH